MDRRADYQAFLGRQTSFIQDLEDLADQGEKDDRLKSLTKSYIKSCQANPVVVPDFPKGKLSLSTITCVGYGYHYDN